MISSRPVTAGKLPKSKSSGGFTNYRTGEVLQNFQHYYDAPAPKRAQTATLGYTRSVQNLHGGKHRVRITSKKKKRQEELEKSIRNRTKSEIDKEMKIIATKTMGIEPETLFKSKLANMRHFRSKKVILEEERKKKLQLRKEFGKNFFKMKYRKTKQEIHEDKNLLVVNKDSKDPNKHYGLLVVE